MSRGEMENDYMIKIVLDILFPLPYTCQLEITGMFKIHVTKNMDKYKSTQSVGYSYFQIFSMQ
jgi:hypothetical protein